MARQAERWALPARLGGAARPCISRRFLIIAARAERRSILRGSEAKMNVTTSMNEWTGAAPADLQRTPIRPIPCAGARVIVTIDGRPYAGFTSRAAAEEAVKLWSGEITGSGLPLMRRAAAIVGWPAVQGRI